MAARLRALLEPERALGERRPASEADDAREGTVASSESDRLLQKMARLGLSRRQLLQMMGTVGAGTAAALQVDPVLAAIHWERHPGADLGS